MQYFCLLINILINTLLNIQINHIFAINSCLSNLKFYLKVLPLNTYNLNKLKINTNETVVCVHPSDVGFNDSEE